MGFGVYGRANHELRVFFGAVTVISNEHGATKVILKWSGGLDGV